MDAEEFDRIMQASIAEEIAARDFYREAAAKVADAGVKAILEELAREEEQHRGTLETLRFDPLARVEFEEPEDTRVAEEEEVPEPSCEMTPKEAFGLAMKREQKAMEIYQKLASGCRDAETRKLYEELARMERGHKTKLERLFVDVAYSEVW
jgi:rubrerythrin